MASRTLQTLNIPDIRLPSTNERNAQTQAQAKYKPTRQNYSYCRAIISTESICLCKTKAQHNFAMTERKTIEL